MKKLFKILGYSFGALVILLLISFIVLLKFLPSAGQIGQFLKPATARSAIQTVDNERASSVMSAATTKAPKAESTENSNIATHKMESEEDQKLMADMTDANRPLSEVCANLQNAHKIKLNGYSLKDFGQGYKDSVLTNEKDPVIQAIKPTLRFVFSQPSMKDLMSSAIEASNKAEDDSLVDKAEFYAKAYAAYNELQNNQKNIEHLMDRSYHLMILSKVLAKRPELLNDSAVNNYCQDIENTLNTSSPINFKEERQAFNEFMQETGVNPKDVGYDPSYHTELKIELRQGNLLMKGGWIDSVLKPSADELRAIKEETDKKEL